MMNIKTIFFSLVSTLPLVLQAQPAMLGWQGEPIIAKAAFEKPSNWTRGYQAGTGDYCTVTADSSGLVLHWKLGPGKRYKYAQCYQVLPAPVSLASVNLIGIDVKGSSCTGNRDVKIKFEDGQYQASFTWERLAAADMWVERLALLKPQFSDGENTNWSKIKVISFEVCSDGLGINESADSGVVHFKNLQAADISKWQRALEPELLEESGSLELIRQHALEAIMDRQVANGLLCTWKEDASSWLYGQGLALKLLALEGQWDGTTAVNRPARVAEKLARFLIAHQDAKGFWPRAWNSNTGNVRQYLEADSTVWFGDFPWIITGLQNYYLKSGDAAALPAIDKALIFLKNLVEPSGKLYTQNPFTGKKTAATSGEAYAATILSLQETGNETLANSLFQYIDSQLWNNELQYWHEATTSVRIVLFGNSWLSQLYGQQAVVDRPMKAMSLVGKTLFTCGYGEPCGLDGIGPVATWYEGTLNYICAGGPGSRYLFEELSKHLNPDGTVPSYNSGFGNMAGVWAETWPSLDGTSWLYYAAARSSPFRVERQVNSLSQPESPVLTIYPNPNTGSFTVSHSQAEPLAYQVFDIGGRLLQSGSLPGNSTTHITTKDMPCGIYILKAFYKGSCRSYRLVMADN